MTSIVSGGALNPTQTQTQSQGRSNYCAYWLQLHRSLQQNRLLAESQCCLGVAAKQMLLGRQNAYSMGKIIIVCQQRTGRVNSLNSGRFAPVTSWLIKESTAWQLQLRARWLLGYFASDMALDSKTLKHRNGNAGIQEETIKHVSLVECYSNHIITRISIQTAGLAFGRHRSVYLSCYRCWWHLCRAFNCRILYGLYLPTVMLTIILYSITHSLFHSRLKIFLLCKS